MWQWFPAFRIPAREFDDSSELTLPRFGRIIFSLPLDGVIAKPQLLPMSAGRDHYALSQGSGGDRIDGAGMSRERKPCFPGSATEQGRFHMEDTPPDHLTGSA